jgi:hypothetical protein
VAGRREDPGGVLALQRSAGNAAVARALLQRVGGWKGASPKTPNAGEMTVTEKTSGRSARRIPIEGIPQGTVKDDAEEVALTTTPDKTKPKETVDHKVSEFTSETSAGGRAIVVIPTDMKLDKDASVDVLLHLHGHTTGYRRNGRSTRDLGVEHIEEQVASSSHPLIAVLPQGGFHSWFGRTGKSFDPTAYLDSVWKILGDVGAWTEAPKRGGLVLSGHSGGDAPMEDMLGKGEAAGTGEVGGLKALFLLDTMYGPGDADKVIKFVRFRLGRDLERIATLPSEKDKVDWIRANGFRVVAKHSGGHYRPQMQKLAAAVAAWLADAETAKVLGAVGTPVSAAVAANLTIDPATGSGADHDAFVGDKNHLRTALDAL